MADLTDGKSLIPGLFEEVRKRLDPSLRSKLEVLLEGVIAGLVFGSGTESGQQSIARGTAGWCRHIVIGKESGCFCEGIDPRRLDVVHPITT
jgi:hypothetical protein